MFAQELPPPSRDVFRCEEGGKVVYSDNPCLGAKRVDVQPTRGLNKVSGTERVGADVRRERQNEQMADALRPVFGETAEQRAKRHRRASLSPTAQAACTKLDAEVSSAEQQERESARELLQSVQARLYQLRLQYSRLKC
ncbi:MAG: hypothetical protein A3K04_04695 [Gallionellales bacterium RBG_16_56_9]|nr:MAG: hypothetical protein A3K04_04695 [Gallionellales bacterium RBG_16_56_9]